jgi:enoyl-CoA hydratase/carnithine racemase
MYFTQSDIQKFDEIPLNFIKTNQKDHVFYLTLNRPEKRNAFTPTMVHELAFALEFAQSQQDIWCVVVQAEGTVFCAGMDLNVFQNPELDTKNENLPKVNHEITIGNAFKNLTKPSIAKVNGAVLAGGFLIICGCTFVVSIEDAQFGLPEVKRGIFPMQVMASLLKIMPQRKALEMCILAKNYTAKEALDLGIVTHLSTTASIESDCESLIENIIEGSPYAIQTGLRTIDELSQIPDNEQHLFLVNQLQQIRNSADAQEGINAFKEKRKPVWKNL